jgi:hypothetical protein
LKLENYTDNWWVRAEYRYLEHVGKGQLFHENALRKGMNIAATAAQSKRNADWGNTCHAGRRFWH